VSRPEPSKPPAKPPRWTVTGVALFVIGLSILATSGLCTAFVGLVDFDPAHLEESLELFGMAALFGGPFILLGLGVMRTGLRERKRD
jgi:hypothetical protein